MPITTLILDLDETIYPSSTGLWNLIGERIAQFIHIRLGLEPEEIHRLQYQYFNTYGTTLRGLELNHGIDAQDYLAFVHDVPIEQILAPDPALYQVLSSYPQRKVIFTNSNKAHSRRVLAQVGIDDLIDDIVDILDISPFCKPQTEAFQKALSLLGILDPTTCLFLDDNLKNIQTASGLGLPTVYVNENHQPTLLYPSIRYLEELPLILSTTGELIKQSE
jgi:putative hydrolase of the HAD superfamily